MKNILMVCFYMDDSDPEQEELIERIRNDVSETISEYSDSWRPRVFIKDDSCGMSDETLASKLIKEAASADKTDKNLLEEAARRILVLTNPALSKEV